MIHTPPSRSDRNAQRQDEAPSNTLVNAGWLRSVFPADPSSFAMGRRFWGQRSILTPATLVLLFLAGIATAEDDGRDHLIVPDGFEAALYSNDDLAHDIFCMTTDAQGRIVVSGPGYVKILEDTDQDNRADKVITFANGPVEGAQGMYFDGPDLLCIGNEGLLRYVDRNRDGQADTAPQLMLKLPTGGEHNTHAIHRGPDGAWYVICGNSSNITHHYATLKTSPLKTARAGAILRLNPTLSGGEIFAEGFRNAYDFDFTNDGEILSYDSDGERDVSLPWYRPCHLYHTMTASDHGWLSLHWKQPAYALEIAPVVDDTGRGSPTGLIAYRHKSFPEIYRNAVFGLDWTFGKIWAFKLSRNGATYKSEKELFAQARGNFGFAPTSGVVGKDGALYVAVGGRGTQGAVYRIAAKATAPEIPNTIDTNEITQFELPITDPAITPAGGHAPVSNMPVITPGALSKEELTAPQELPVRPIAYQTSKPVVNDQTKTAAATTTIKKPEPAPAKFHPNGLIDVLEAPQPLSSWSRQEWVPKAFNLREQAFIAAALDTNLTTSQRIRAIEILTELFSGVDRDMMGKLALDPTPGIRARAVWGWGRSFPANPQRAVIRPYLIDQDAWVCRCALESLLSTDPVTLNTFRLEIAKALGNDDRQVRLLASKLAVRLNERDFRALSADAVKGGWAGALHVGLAYAARTGKVNAYALNIGTQIVRNKELANLHLDAVLLIQAALGTVGPAPNVVPVFESYTPLYNLSKNERDLDPVRIALAEIYPTSNPQVNHEIVRTFAMLQTYNAQTVTALLSQITPESDPVDDLHILFALGVIPADRDSAQLNATASAFLNLSKKIRERGYVIETHFDDRMDETYEAHVKTSPGLTDAIVGHANFGHPDHVRFLSQIREEQVEGAFDSFVKKLMEDPENYPWTEDSVFVLGQTEIPEVLDMIREHADDNALRPAVMMALSELGDPSDRALILSGMADYQVDVVAACLTYFQADPQAITPDEMVQMYAAARRLDQGEQAYQVRSDIMDLLFAKTGQTHGFISGSLGFRDQTQSLLTWRDWLTKSYPDQMKELAGQDPQSLDTWMKKLETVNWSSGDAARGQHVFNQASCSRCHGGAKALGPDLAGVSNRFSRADLLTAIVAPNRDVSARYQTLTISTVQGKVYTGLIVYEAKDGLVLRDSSNNTFRIEAKDIDVKQPSNLSLMPEGLLDKLTDQEVADLMAYLQGIGQTKIATPATNTTK